MGRNAADPAPPPDWEAKLARIDLAELRFRGLRNRQARQRERLNRERRRQIQYRAAWEAFIARYAGSVPAAEAEISLLQRFEPDDLDLDLPSLRERVAWLLEFLERYPDYTSLHWRALHRLSRILLRRDDLPLEDRRAAYERMLPFSFHQPRFLLRGGARPFVMGLDIPEPERFALALRLSRAMGPTSGSREFLFRFLERYLCADGTTAAAARDACRAFRDVHGDDNIESRRGMTLEREAALALKNTAAAKAIDWIAERDAEHRDRLEAVFARAGQALDRGDLPAARAILEVSDLEPAFLAEPFWLTLLEHPALGEASESAREDLLWLAIRVGAPGVIGERVMDRVRDESPRQLAFLGRFVGRHVEEANVLLQGWANPLNRLLRAAAERPDEAVGAYRDAARALERMGVRDTEADLRFQAGLRLWWTEPEAAEAMLARAVAIAPESPGGVRSGWLLSLLRGERSLVHPPAHRGEPPAPAPAAPAPSPLAATPTPFAFRDGSDGRAPARLDPGENLVAGAEATATAAPETARLASDGDPATAWVPPSLPAVLTLPLRRTASLSSVGIRTTSDMDLIFTLLDDNGRALSRFRIETEGEGEAPDAGDVDEGAYGEETEPAVPVADIPAVASLPVPGVRFVRLEVTQRATASGGISGVEAFGTPYPLRAEDRSAPAPLPAGTRQLEVALDYAAPRIAVRYEHIEAAARRGVRSARTETDGDRPRDAAPVMDFRDARVGAISVPFFGDNASLHVDGAGALDWRLLGGASGRIENPDGEAKALRLADGLGAGPHLLSLGRRALPVTPEGGGEHRTRFVHLEVEARPGLQAAIRFRLGDDWSAWRGPLDDGMRLPVPPNAAAYQLRAAFDNRPTLGRKTATLRRFEVVPTDAAPTDAPEALPAAPKSASWLDEALDEAARLVSERRVAVTYPRDGGRREYAAARAIAEKAGLYLAPDDLADLEHGRQRFAFPELDRPPATGVGLSLVVGRPAVHRHGQRIVSLLDIWNDPVYLNDPEGRVAVVRGPDGEPRFVLAIGETPGAVAAAAERLAARLAPHRAEAPWRVFPSDTLEVIFPWQLHADRPRTDPLALCLGVNDRRSLQFGLAAERELAELAFDAGSLHRQDGTPFDGNLRVRTIGFYEHVRFFGAMRVPNMLLDSPALPMPAHSAMGVWVTARSTPQTLPGVYQGELTVSGGGHRERLPLRLTVQPVRLPDSGPSTFFCFASVPWWFSEGTPVYERAVRALARNTAEHGIRLMDAGMPFDVADMEEPVVPCGYAMAGTGVDVSGLEWAPWHAEVKDLSEDLRTALPALGDRGEAGAEAANDDVDALVLEIFGGADEVREEGEQLALFVDLGGRTMVRDVVVGAGVCGELNHDGSLRLAYRDAQGEWIEAGEGLVGRKPRESAFLFRPGVATDMLRFRLECGGAFRLGRVALFTDRERRWPVTLDFSRWDRYMDLGDQAAMEQGLEPPIYVGRTDDSPDRVAQVLVGTRDANAASRLFAEQFVEHLERTGRAERFMLKVGDEPRDFADWVREARPYREGGLRTTTAHSGNYPDIEVGVGVMNPWCPYVGHDIFRPFFDERRAAGDALWWYFYSSPGYGPNLRLVAQPFQALPFYWLTARLGFSGGMAYSAQSHSPSSPESSPVPFRYDHGMNHRIVFLPDGSVLDTYRRELEAEAIRDNMLIERIRGLARDRRKEGQYREADALLSELDQTLESVLFFGRDRPRGRTYATRPAAWLAAREALYDLAAKAADPGDYSPIRRRYSR